MLQRIVQRTLISFENDNHARLIRTPLTFSVASHVIPKAQTLETTNLQFCPFTTWIKLKM